jgi:HD-GYP domain-containing protein (c-di-GMP phosphodiesterase class II)
MLAKPGGEEITVVSDKPVEPEMSPSGEQIPRNIQMHTFLAHSAVAVPLRTRSISVGKQRRALDERVIGNLMVLNKQHGAFDGEDTQLLEILASQASTLLQISLLYNDANGLFLDFIKTLAATIDAKDPYTRGHSQRVSDFSVQIAREIGLSNEEINDIRIGSLLHDIGKIGVPDRVLLKAGPLDDDDFRIMRKHPEYALEMLGTIPNFSPVLEIPYYHHEKWDGSGYPHGLSGEQIPLPARIFAVIDVYDALCSDRPYRPAWHKEEALEYIQHESGRHFDPHVVTAFMALLLSAARQAQPA